MKPLMLSLLVSTVLLGCVSTQSPTGRSQTLLYSDAQMQKLGGESFETLKQSEKISKNKQLTTYVNCVSNRIISVLPDKSQRWEVVLFESDQVNAFALPGGHIGVYTGLLKVAENQDQLAAVIGHEITHVLAQHGNEQVSRSQLTGIGMQVADVALGASGVANKDLYMAGLGLGAQVGIILPFGRDQESEADLLGLELMAKAGFDPQASISLWQNMAKKGGSNGPALLSTHPSHSTRISDLQAAQTQVNGYYAEAKKQSFPECRNAQAK